MKILRRIARLDKSKAETVVVQVKKPVFEKVKDEDGNEKQKLKRAAKFQMLRSDEGGRGYKAMKKLYAQGVISLKKTLQ